MDHLRRAGDADQDNQRLPGQRLIGKRERRRERGGIRSGAVPFQRTEAAEAGPCQNLRLRIQRGGRHIDSGRQRFLSVLQAIGKRVRGAERRRGEVSRLGDAGCEIGGGGQRRRRKRSAGLGQNETCGQAGSRLRGFAQPVGCVDCDRKDAAGPRVVLQLGVAGIRRARGFGRFGAEQQRGAVPA